MAGEFRAPYERDPWPIGLIVLVTVFAAPLVLNTWFEILVALEPPSRYGWGRICGLSSMFDVGLPDVLLVVIFCYGYPLLYSSVPVALVSWGGAHLVRALWRRGSNLVAVYAAAVVYGLLWGGVWPYALDVWSKGDQALVRWMGLSGAGAGLTLGVFTAFVVARGRRPSGEGSAGTVDEP